MPLGLITDIGRTIKSIAPAGEKAYIEVSDVITIPVNALELTTILVTLRKPVPVNVTFVPPAGGPPLGENPVRVGMV